MRHEFARTALQRRFKITGHLTNVVYRFAASAMNAAGPGPETDPRIEFHQCATYFKDTGTGCQVCTWCWNLHPLPSACCPLMVWMHSIVVFCVYWQWLHLAYRGASHRLNRCTLTRAVQRELHRMCTAEHRPVQLQNPCQWVQTGRKGRVCQGKSMQNPLLEYPCSAFMTAAT